MNNDINVINDLDMSIWGLILEADFVVRLVMLSLLFLSIFSWSIIFVIETIGYDIDNSESGLIWNQGSP